MKNKDKPCHDIRMPAGGARTKWCAVCGRKIEWRRKWRKNWSAVKYCSKKCRSTPLTSIDRKLEEAILDLLETLADGATICPSEAARRVRPPDESEQWRQLMEAARSAARRLSARNRIVMTRRGRAVDPSRAKGAIRLKLVDIDKKSMTDI
jgi:hypothetical protein